MEKEKKKKKEAKIRAQKVLFIEPAVCLNTSYTDIKTSHKRVVNYSLKHHHCHDNRRTLLNIRKPCK